jgi:hypothetical protein
MTDKKPEKVVEPSPFEKWWAEVLEWREKRQGTKRQEKAEQFNTPSPIRSKQSRFFVSEEEEESSRNKKKSVINISGMVMFGLVEVVLGLIGIVFRFAFWIAIVGGLLWALTTFDVKTVVKDKAVDEVKKEAAEIKSEVGDVLHPVFQDIADELNEFAKNWSIEIRQTTEDGKEVKVLEIGTEISTKKKTPPETSE